MLQIFADKFRGISYAKLSCAPIALLCGRNEQGKSSIIDGVRAVLEGNTTPYGLTKDQLGQQLIFGGADTAAVTIEQYEGESQRRSVQIRWPSQDVATNGAPIRASTWATGSARFNLLTARERAQMLAQYLRTDPTLEEFTAVAEPMGHDADEIKAIWKDVQTQGWDGAWDKYRQEATKLKGGWDQITGAKYGVKVGGNWRPKSWTAEHEALTDAELQQFLDEDTKALESAIGTVAINAEEKNRLESLIKQIPKLKELLETRTRDGTRAAGTLEKAEAALRAIPVLEPDDWPKCPHCHKAVQVQAAKGGGSVLSVPGRTMTPEQRDQIRNKVEDAERVLAEAQKARDEAATKYRAARDDLQRAEDAKAQLEKAGAEDGPKVDLDELRTNLANTKAIMAAKEKIRAALKQHTQVIKRLDLAEALAPDGMRKTKLAERLDAFNETLATLCETADWDTVRITPELELTLDDVRYDLCARSGRMRIDVTLQVGLAQLDGSEVLVVDDADMMDGAGRNGLFALLADTGLYCLVAMMLVRPQLAPDLEELGLGGTWWINEAHAISIKEAKEAAAA